MSDIIECRSLCFNYGDGDSKTSVLNNLNFKVETNEKIAIVNNVDKNEALKKAENILKNVGLENRITHKPSELSGGERQRVAIARAMITEPACLLADEPTGNLDEKNARDVLDLIIELNNNQNTALLIVTHDLSIANKMSRRFDLTDGSLNER